MQFYISTSNHVYSKYRAQDYLQWEADEEAVAGALCPWSLGVSYPSERGEEKSGRGVTRVENTKCCELELEFNADALLRGRERGWAERGSRRSARGCGSRRSSRGCGMRSGGAASPLEIAAEQLEQQPAVKPFRTICPRECRCPCVVEGVTGSAAADKI